MTTTWARGWLALAFLLFSVCLTGRPALADVAIRGVHTSAEGDSTRVVITLSQMTRYQYGILPADVRSGRPPRVYVDVHDVVLGSRDGSVVQVSDSRVTRIRTGQHKERIARIVVEVQGTLTPKILQMETPPRIIVELSGQGRSDAVTAASSNGPRSSSRASASEKQAPAGNMIVSPAAKAVLAVSPAQQVDAASKASTQQPPESARNAPAKDSPATPPAAKDSRATPPVSASALARLQAPAGKGVVTLKGARSPAGAEGLGAGQTAPAGAASVAPEATKPADSSRSAAVLLEPRGPSSGARSQASTELSPPQAKAPGTRGGVDAQSERDSQPAAGRAAVASKPSGEQPPLVAGRGTQIQAVTAGTVAGSANESASSGRPRPAAATPASGSQPPTQAAVAAPVAGQAPAGVGPLASAGPAVRPPVQPGRGTDLLPMAPLPPGAQPTRGMPEPAKPKRLRVVLDPGHGGKDPGAQGPGGTEKESVLDIALRVAAKLKKNLGVEVHLTRTDDSYVSLGERKDLANRVEADLFVSIHANASRNADLYGIETYYLKNSNDRATLRLARLENGVDMLIKGNDVSTDADLNYILSDIIQGQKEADSVLLANHIQNQLCSNLEKRYDSIHSLGVKQGPFLVLDGTYMPAVLVEAGFITNGGEGRRLGAGAYREAVADGIYRGIKAYLEDDRANDLT